MAQNESAPSMRHLIIHSQLQGQGKLFILLGVLHLNLYSAE